MDRPFAVTEQEDLAGSIPVHELVERRLCFVDVMGQGQHVEHLQIFRRSALRHVDAGADLVEADRSDAARLEGERELRAAAIRARQERRRPVAVGRTAPGEEHDARRGVIALRQTDRRGQRVACPQDHDVLDLRGVLHDTCAMSGTLALRTGHEPHAMTVQVTLAQART